MYRIKKELKSKTTIKRNSSVEGETIEKKIRRIMMQGEAIEDGAPLIFVEEKDGVPHETNIRTDRFDLAVEALDSLTRDSLAKSEGGSTPQKDKNNNDDKNKESKKDSGEAAPKDGGKKEG